MLGKVGSLDLSYGWIFESTTHLRSYMEFQGSVHGIPDRCVIHVLSQRNVLFPGSIFAGNMSL